MLEGAYCHFVIVIVSFSVYCRKLPGIGEK